MVCLELMRTVANYGGLSVEEEPLQDKSNIDMIWGIDSPLFDGFVSEWNYRRMMGDKLCVVDDTSIL